MNCFFTWYNGPGNYCSLEAVMQEHFIGVRHACSEAVA